MVAVITDMGMATLKGQGIKNGTPPFMLHGFQFPAYETEDLFAWAVSLYVIIDDYVFHLIETSTASAIDQHIRKKKTDVKDAEIRFAAMKPPFRLNLESYQPKWPLVKRR
jgi:hypothetical protein